MSEVGQTEDTRARLSTSGRSEREGRRIDKLITRQQRQEDLSLAYLLAVVAKSGLTFDPPKRDFGIDGTISRITKKDRRLVPSGVRLDVQLKSSINATVENDSVAHKLEVRAYEILRDDSAECPRILVLHLLPRDEVE
jgi:hypothetical protein